MSYRRWALAILVFGHYLRLALIRRGFIVVVKKTLRYSNVFLLQPLIPAFLISELIFEKRYKTTAIL